VSASGIANKLSLQGQKAVALMALPVIAAEGSLLFLSLCIHSPQSFALVMYCQNLDFWEDVCAKYSGGAMFVNFEGEVNNLKL
jgi:hypothetical protein